MRAIPLSVFITWPLPNYVNPPTQGYGALIVNVILIAITVPLVSLRVFTRWYMRRWLGLDDLFCVLAVIFAVGLSIATIIANYVYGCNRHIYDIPIANLEAVLKIIMATKALFTCASTFIRQSLLCLYLRLISDSGMSRFKWAVHCATILNVSIGIAFICLTIFQCTPVSAYWMYPSDEYGKCLDEGIVTLVCGVIITCVDFIVLMLPVPIVLRLQMSFREKIGVIVLLNLGLVASIMAIVRTWYIWKATIGSYDESWYAYPLWMIAVIEIDLAIMASCAPAIRPYLVHHAPWLLAPFRLIGSAVGSVCSSLSSRKASASHRGAGKEHSSSDGSNPPTIQNLEDKGHMRASNEKETYTLSSTMERGNGFADTKEARVDRTRSRGVSLAPSETPTLHRRPSTSQGFGLGMIKSLFDNKRGRESKRSQSEQRRYIERQLYSVDSRSARGSSLGPEMHSRPLKRRRSEHDAARRRKSSEGLQISKPQAYEIDSAPTMSPEEMIALQSSLAGISVSDKPQAATIYPSRPLVSRNFSDGAREVRDVSRRRGQDLAESSGNERRRSIPQQPLGNEADAGASLRLRESAQVPDDSRPTSIWDIKRREWEAHGRRWPDITQQQPRRQTSSSTRQSTDVPPLREHRVSDMFSATDHIVEQSRRVSKSTFRNPDPPVESVSSVDTTSSDGSQSQYVGHIADQAIPGRPIVVTRALRSSAAAQARRGETSSSVASFLDDASEEGSDGSARGVDDTPHARGRRTARSKRTR